MKAAIIVVSYNTRDLLRQSVASIYDSVQASGMDRDGIAIVVVDNASTDSSAEMIAREFPHVRLIASPENLGFTRANNLALASIGFSIQGIPPGYGGELPDYVLLLNSDAQLVDDALGRMVQFLGDHPSAGACGPRLEYADGTFQHGAFRFPTLFQIALDLFPLSGLPGAHRLQHSGANGRFPARLWNGGTPFPVDFVLGAALMMRGTAIQRIGGLDEGFFMYCEEMDWCLRLAQAGLSTYAVPAARVIHHEAQSSRQTPWPSFCRLWQSRLRFHDKHRNHYLPGFLFLVRVLIRAGMRVRSMQTRQRFACGRVTGTEAAEELSAYAHVARL
jgi:N-acetylglucosaminyl-diphospho-decaprenol L-rhamnosyltransferase